MTPEAATAIRIADAHLPGQSPERRSVLAKDIVLAIMHHAEKIAYDAIEQVAKQERKR